MQRSRLMIHLQMLEDDLQSMKTLYPTAATFNLVFAPRAQALLDAAAPEDRLWLEMRIDEILWWHGQEPIVLKNRFKVLVIGNQ